MSRNVYLTHGPTDRIVDTLRISEREAAAILEAMNSAQHDLPMAELRDSDRLVCRPTKGVVVQIQHPGGSGGMFLVWPRNVSRTGMGFLHGNFIYPNTIVVVHLRRPNGPSARVTGKIMRCRHVSGVLHEIGVRFDQALDMAMLTEYTRGEPQLISDGSSSSQTPVRLTGRVLVIDHCIDDRDLMNFICTSTGLECTEASMLEEAQGFLQNHRYDLVLTDVELNDGTMEEIIRGLRTSRYPGPVIGIWQLANNRIDTSSLEKAGFSDLLTKPLETSRVIAVLAKYLQQATGGRRSNEALLSEQWSNEAMRPLILAFLGRLENHLTRLQSLAEREPGADVDSSLLKLCLDLQSSSGSYGFPTISDAVMDLYRLAGDHQSQAAQLKSQVDRLTALIRSACLVRQRTPAK